MMNYVVYKITHVATGRYYIGKTTTTKWADGYMGSGNRIKALVDRYGKQAFRRQSLRKFKNEAEAFAYEAKRKKDAKADTLCLNER